MSDRPSVILSTGVAAVFHSVILFSVFLLFAGHNAPGGGFVGGLVAAAAFVLRYVDGGTAAVADASPVAPQTLLGVGLTLGVGTGLAGWLVEGSIFETSSLSADIPVLGTVKTTSSLVFEVGIYLVVIGLVLAVLRSLGEEADR